MFGRFIFTWCALFLWTSSAGAVVVLAPTDLAPTDLAPTDLAPTDLAPTDLAAKWIDALTVEVSWTGPKKVQQDCVKFVCAQDGAEFLRTSSISFRQNLLTESSSEWIFSVRTVSICPMQNRESSTAQITVEPPKPRGEVSDFRCYLSNSDMNCSWITNLDLNHFSLSYRDCGTKDELLKDFKTCDRIYESGSRRGCVLRGNFLQRDLCLVASSPNTTFTFRAPKAFRAPEKMQISEHGNSLILTLKPPKVEIPDNSRYNICYSACNGHKMYVEHPLERKSMEISIPYSKGCMFRVQHQTYTPDTNPIYSDWSEEAEYGWTDRSLTVVAIVIPIIVSLSVIVSCVCFKRHKDIIFPDVPDPSTMFKEMMNGNKDKPKVHTYEAVEPIDPIVLVPHIPPRSGPVPT